jgi:hypothetical protein
MRVDLPVRGAEVMTPDGPGIVVDSIILQESVKVRLFTDKKKRELGEDVLLFKKEEVKKVK